jgi:hypothetical protein
VAISPDSFHGQLTNSKATLFTCTGDTKLLLISLVNTDTAAVTINVYLHDGTASRRISAKDRSLASGEAYYLTGPWNLESGDLIEGEASTTTVVDYWGSVEVKS